MPQFPRPQSVAVSTKKPVTKPAKDEDESAALKALKKGTLPAGDSASESEDKKDKGKALK